MNKKDQLLLWSALGWVVFIIIGWLHYLPLLNVMPHPGNSIVEFARMVTRLGNPMTLIYATAILVLYLAFVKREWLLAGMLTLEMLAGWMLMDLLKTWWAIPRPSGAHLVIVSDFTYPSGHAMLSMAFYGFIAWYLSLHKFPRWYSALAVLIALLIGISRPLFNVHFPADVVGGWSAGLGWLLLIQWLYYQLKNRTKKKEII